MVLLGLILSFAVPQFEPGRWRADSAVQELMISLNAAQRLAVMRQHDVIVTFLPSERRIRVHRDADNDGTVDVDEDSRVVELPETVGFARGSTPAIDGITADVSFTDPGSGPQLVFHRNGSASESGMAYLRPLEGSMSTALESSRAVSVERATGQVRCFTYRRGSWESAC